LQDFLSLQFATDTIMSDNVLLRTMTLKSRINFGQYRDLCVQELINLNVHIELIKMYYLLEKITFTEDVLTILRINDDRAITKPGKDYGAYKLHVCNILDEMMIFSGVYDKDNPARFDLLNRKKAARKQKIIGNCIRQNKERSKIHNRNRNQGHG
jgi:hypothetical protein